MNKVILTGNLTKSPELKQAKTGKKYVRFGIAVQRGIKRDEVDFFNIVAWEKTAEFICRYFLKGSRIVIEGHLQSTNYTDDRGVKRYAIDVIVENVEFGGSKKPAATNDYGNSFSDEVYFG